MRVLRTILGLLLLIIGLPALLAGAGCWAAMQHRDAGGAFSGDLQQTVTPGYAVVVPDADGVLRRDAPFARAGDTRLRLTAYTSDGPAFIGIAPAAKVARYLADVPQEVVTTVDLGTGALPVATDRVAGASAPISVPGRQSFWLKSATGGLDWHPSALRGRDYSLVIMSPSAQPGFEVTATAELSPGWLNSATWSLLILGSLLVMAGIVVLAWPGRRREVVYVVEPSQVPDLMVAIGAPLPLSRTGGGRHAGTHRPRTLADAAAKSSQRALPPLAWPPSQPGTATAPVSPAISASPAQVAAAAPNAPAGGPSAVPPSPAEYAAATAIPGTARGIGQRTPAPGEPLSLIGGVPSKGVPPSFAPPSSSSPTAPPSPAASASVVPPPSSVSAPASSGSAAPAAAANEAPGDRSAERVGRRRAVTQPSDTPVFEATAVGAWVAETAAARARDTQARAAAVLAAEAARRQAAEPAKGGATEADKSPAAEVAKGDAAKSEAPVSAKPEAPVSAKPEAPVTAKVEAAESVKPEVAEPARPQAAEPAKRETAEVKPQVAEDAKREGAEASKAETPVGGPAAGAHAAPDQTTESEMAPAAASGRDSDTAVAAARNEPDRSVPERLVSKSPLEPAAPARPSGPESTAPAPARPAPPNRPVVPAPARPAPPPRPNPDPRPSRPAAERPAVSQPAVSQPAVKDGDIAQPSPANADVGRSAGPRAGVAQRPANGPSPLQAAVTTGATVGSVRSATSDPSGVPATQPKDGQSQAPVHVSISDRPAVVSQPGSSIPGGASDPAADTVRRPVAEAPRTTLEIQARLQAAMKSSTRPSGEPRSSAPPGPPTAVPPSTTAVASVRPASSTEAVRVGVAGRRDYPASARRDNDAVRSVRTGVPAAKAATSGSKSMSGEDTPATKGGSHIGGQRVDSDEASPDPTAAEAGGKATARRAAAKATKPDRSKSAKPETQATSVPGARLSAYAEEAAELLAGLSPDRKRRKQDGDGDHATEARPNRKEPAKD